MLNTCRRWNGDKIVTVAVVVAWLLVWIVPGFIHSMEERSARETDEAAFLQDKPRMMETMRLAYEAARDGNAAAFEEVVDIDSFLFQLKKEYPELTKQEVLNAIKGKEVLDPNAPYGIKVLRWTLVNAEPENTFYKFVKYSDGKYNTIEKYSKTIGSQKEYFVELAFLAYGYKKGTLRLNLKERDGRFYISHDDRDFASTSILNYYSKLATLSRFQTWDEAEINAAGTLKWKFGQSALDSHEGRITIPVEIVAIDKNLERATFAAEIIEVNTGQVIDTIAIYVSGRFVAGENILVIGRSSKLDTTLMQLFSDGYVKIGRIGPVGAAYEDKYGKFIDFSHRFGVY